MFFMFCCFYCVFFFFIHSFLFFFTPPCLFFLFSVLFQICSFVFSRPPRTAPDSTRRPPTDSFPGPPSAGAPSPGPPSAGPPSAGPPKISRFFLLSNHNFLSFFPLLEVFSCHFGGVGSAGKLNCACLGWGCCVNLRQLLQNVKNNFTLDLRKSQ